MGSNTTSYAWDFENRLTSVTLPGSGGTVSFKYDPFGKRIYKSTPSATSVFAYDGDNLVEETNSSGTPVARYTQTDNVDEPLAVLRSGATSFYHPDGLGSITSLTSSSGVIAQTYTFDSFGNQTASSGTLTNPFRYTSREYDSETSLYFYRARYYDQNVGRFINEDPIRFEDDINMFSYVANDAPNLRDPLGLYSVDPKSCKCDQIGTLKRVEDSALANTSFIDNPRLRDCIIKKMKKGTVHCESGKCRGDKGWAGHAIPKVGSGVSICSDTFSTGWGDLAIVCTLIHEFAHKCVLFKTEKYIENVEKQVPGCSKLYGE